MEIGEQGKALFLNGLYLDGKAVEAYFPTLV